MGWDFLHFNSWTNMTTPDLNPPEPLPPFVTALLKVDFKVPRLGSTWAVDPIPQALPFAQNIRPYPRSRYKNIRTG